MCIRNKYKIFSLFLALFLLPSVISGSSAKSITRYDDEISEEIRKEIESKSRFLYGALEQGNSDLSGADISKKFRDTFAGNDSFFNQSSHMLKGLDIELIHMYHTKVDDIKDAPEIISGPYGDDRALQIRDLPFYSNEKVNVFFKTSNQGMEYLVFFSFGKYAEGWLCDQVFLGYYSWDNKTAVDYYELARKKFENMEQVSASVYLMIMSNFLKPADFLAYKHESDYVQYSMTVFEELNRKYVLPIVMDDATSLLGIQVTHTRHGLCPAVLYLSNISVHKETPELKKEALSVAGKTLKLFPDMRNNFSILHIQAYNQMPTEKDKQYSVYSTFVRISDMSVLE